MTSAPTPPAGFDFDARLRQPELNRSQRANTLFVGIRPTYDLRDGRRAFNVATAAISAILDRTDHSWAIRRYVEDLDWDNPTNGEAPLTVASIDLDHPQRPVAGSFPIAIGRWGQAIAAAGSTTLLTVPTHPGSDGDDRQLRGRRCDVRLFGRDYLGFAAFDGAGNKII